MTASDKEFEDIVKVSGHNFHARVVSTLRALEWTAVYRPQFVGHRIEPYAALATG
jgi:hypothetical protein